MFILFILCTYLYVIKITFQESDKRAAPSSIYEHSQGRLAKYNNQPFIVGGRLPNNAKAELMTENNWIEVASYPYLPTISGYGVVSLHDS